MENLYDYRDDPFDGCDFAGNSGCPGVSPPFDYVPASDQAYQTRLGQEAQVIIGPLKTPDLLLMQEAEDQDICTVVAGALSCGTTNNADGKPDTLQELALAVAAAGGPSYDAAYDRDGADDRGITAAFLYRTDRLTLAPAGTGVLSADPGVVYRSAGLGVQRGRLQPEGAQRGTPVRCGHLDRRGRVQCVHPGAAGGEVPGRRRAGREGGRHHLGDQQPLLVHPGRPGRTAAGAGQLRRRDRQRHPGRRPGRPDRVRR